MKFKDADLRRAFESLDVDPASDAARVLSAIPPTPIAAQPIWPLITAAGISGAAIAALLIWVLSPRTTTAADDATLEEEDPPAIKAPETPGPLRPPETLPPSEDASDLSLEMNLGQINVITATSTDPLSPGQRLMFGKTYETTEESIVQIALPGGAQARIGSGSRWIFEDERSINLLNGLLWLKNVEGHGAQYVITSEGDIEVEPGAVISLAASEERVQLLTVMGHAVFDTLASGKLRLSESQACQSTRGLVDDPHDAVPEWYFLRWQVPMLRRFDREEEVVMMLATLSQDLLIAERSETARKEFRRLGALSARALNNTLAQVFDDAELHRMVAFLLCDIADGDATDALLDLLRDKDAEVRVRAARSLRRVTGITSGKDPEFWGDSPFATRDPVRQSWRRRINLGR